MKYICECGNTCEVSEAKYLLRPLLYCSQCQKITSWTAIEWPHIEIDQEIWFNGDTYIRLQESRLCFNCKTNQTQWVSLSFEGHLCSPVCAEEAWDEFWSLN